MRSWRISKSMRIQITTDGSMNSLLTSKHGSLNYHAEHSRSMSVGFVCSASSYKWTRLISHLKIRIHLSTNSSTVPSIAKLSSIRKKRRGKGKWVYKNSIFLVQASFALSTRSTLTRNTRLTTTTTGKRSKVSGFCRQIDKSKSSTWLGSKRVLRHLKMKKSNLKMVRLVSREMEHKSTISTT